MKYAVLTTKHHDGFALWQTKYTDYSVKSSPWKDGKGDVVREFCDACHNNGIACGLYYSLAQWDSGSGITSDDSDYENYVAGQLSELLSDYGKIDYLWLDGAFSKNGTYDVTRMTSLVRSLQPDMAVFGIFGRDTIGVGNEDGYVDARNSYVKNISENGKEIACFACPEGDCRIRDTWFYDDNEPSLKSLEELMGMYETTVGRGANFLLNIAPDEKGQLCACDTKRLHELAGEIRNRYFKPLPFSEAFTEPDGRLCISYPEDVYAHMITDTVNLPLVRRVLIEEDVTEGEGVKAWRLYAAIPSKYPYAGWEFCVCEGHGIGHKRICSFPAMRTPRFRLEIVSHDGEYKIKSIKAFE